MDKYIEALYQENRNAIPSWQGYHYQGQAAVLYVLRYILDVFENRPDDVSNIFMKIEWLEDFTIFEGDLIKEVYQVKKTMDKKSYEDVIQNFIMEYKTSNENIKFKAIYSEFTDIKYTQIDSMTFNKIYSDFITNTIIYQINLLVEKKNDLTYWKDNLNLQNKDSELKNIRGYVRKFIEYSQLTIEECNKIADTHLKVLSDRLKATENDYEEFIYSFDNIQILDIDSEIISTIDELINRGYIVKSDILNSEQIKDYLYIIVYAKLMSLKSKKIDGDKFIINYKMIENAFCDGKVIGKLWRKKAFDKREEIISEIKNSICEDECTNTDENKCDNCVFSQFKCLDIISLIDNCNLELPSFTPENARISIENKLSNDKSNFLIDVILEHKKNTCCNLDRDLINLNKNDIEANISQIISGSGRRKKYVREDILENIWDHLNIYMDYENIVTKEYDDEINYQDIKMINNYEKIIEERDVNKKYPTFMELPPIRFISKDRLKEK
ncbi:hypothetical protein CBU02nite_07480 [Clostridium butyricum]|uniref:DUF4297 domain-containing protein n=1 Tax=Clostridium butyricum TaxID=1492 RepID=A0A512TJ13_CLOBU|nr:hypothetical protein [Clostridium butyricum]MCQ2013501.1 hypothetical protein [Clostridium butyricum]MCQ2025718.1 hypothetical protein [Clostridium butyricum]NOW22351.1 hypothetical protein [Clostridium butyricum]GEQ20242.1 hypothetical protein CBU02nite_07480 [Clostridium butyricum]